MEDGIEAFFRKNLVQFPGSHGSRQIRAHDFDVTRGGGVAFAEVVENDYTVVRGGERPDRMGADVAGAPGDEERGHVSRAPRRSR